MCLSPFSMASMEEFLLQLRAAAASHDPEWLHRQIEVITEEDSPVAGTSGAWRARRSRPPERFSPPSSPRAQRHLGSPCMVDPLGAPAPPSIPAVGVSSGRSRSHQLAAEDRSTRPALLMWPLLGSRPGVGEAIIRGPVSRSERSVSPLSNVQEGRSLRSGGGDSRVPS